MNKILFKGESYAIMGVCFEVYKEKGTPLRQVYRPDLVCYDQIVLELKAVSALTDAHRAQVHNYLKASGLRLGLLLNFGHHPKLEYERIVK